VAFGGRQMAHILKRAGGIQIIQAGTEFPRPLFSELGHRFSIRIGQFLQLGISKRYQHQRQKSKTIYPFGKEKNSLGPRAWPIPLKNYLFLRVNPSASARRASLGNLDSCTREYGRSQQQRGEDVDFIFWNRRLHRWARIKNQNLRSSASSAVKTGFQSLADLLDLLGFAIGFGDARVQAF
jgi:hypothetical protein